MNTIEGEILGDVHIIVYKTINGDKFFQVLVGNDNVTDIGEVVEDMLKKY